MELPEFFQLNPRFSSSPQISPEHIEQIAKLGFKSIINNRPDDEEINQPTNQSIEIAAKNHQLAFAFHPVTSNFTEEEIYKMAELIWQLPAPIYAFCRSGNRTTNIYYLAKKLIDEQGEFGIE